MNDTHRLEISHNYLFLNPLKVQAMKLHTQYHPKAILPILLLVAIFAAFASVPQILRQQIWKDCFSKQYLARGKCLLIQSPWNKFMSLEKQYISIQLLFCYILQNCLPRANFQRVSIWKLKQESFHKKLEFVNLTSLFMKASYILQ